MSLMTGAVQILQLHLKHDDFDTITKRPILNFSRETALCFKLATFA